MWKKIQMILTYCEQNWNLFNLQSVPVSIATEAQALKSANKLMIERIGSQFLLTWIAHNTIFNINCNCQQFFLHCNRESASILFHSSVNPVWSLHFQTQIIYWKMLSKQLKCPKFCKWTKNWLSHSVYSKCCLLEILKNKIWLFIVVWET